MRGRRCREFGHHRCNVDVLGATLLGAESRPLVRRQGAVDTPPPATVSRSPGTCPADGSAASGRALIRCGRNDHLLRYVHTHSFTVRIYCKLCPASGPRTASSGDHRRSVGGDQRAGIGVTYQACTGDRDLGGPDPALLRLKDDLILAGCRAIVERASDQPTAPPRSASRSAPGSARRTHPTTTSFRLGVAVWYAYLVRGGIDPAIGAIIAESAQGTIKEAQTLLSLWVRHAIKCPVRRCD